MRLNMDTPQIHGNQLPPDLNRWFTTLIDQLNTNFGNIIADLTIDIGNAGAGPISVAVPGLTADSIVTATIQSSTNSVSVNKVIATSTGFDILFSGDPGLNCIVNYIAFITNWQAQGA